MKLSELHRVLHAHPQAQPRFILPEGNHVPAHFHVTEVGHVEKNFIDCGGAIGQVEACVLQLWLGQDLEHRLNADRFAQILQLGGRVLPKRDLEVEIEYDGGVVAQYPITRATPAGDHLEITLGNRQTQCLARERRSDRATAQCC